jgi:hypothetical protein
MSRSTALLALLLVACPAPGVKPDTDDTPPVDTDTDTDTDADADTDTDADADADTDADTDTAPPDGDVHSLTWRLHEDVESLVYASWTQEIAGTISVEFSFEEDKWMSTSSWELEAGSYEKLLVGIPFEHEASWRVVVEGGESYDGQQITTGDIPNGWPRPVLETSEPSAWYEPGKYLMTSINQDSGGWMSGTYWTFIIDREGRPVYAHKAPQRHWTLFVQVAQSGDHFLWDEATYWSNWDGGAGSTVHLAYLDQEIDEIWTPGLHHAFVQLPDTNLVWGSQYHGGEEALVEKALSDPDDDTGTVLWTCDEDWPNAGRCESNGLHYSPLRDAFLYSFYTNDSLVEVDHKTGESLWWAGEVNGGYKFDPTDSQFAWQHGVTYNDEGHLMVSTHNVSGPLTTLVREYEVDHESETLHQVWSYDANVFASTNGDAWRLDNGNTLHLLGSAGQIKEVTADGTTVWHVDWQAEKLLGRGEFIEDLYTLVSPEMK